MPGLVPDVGRVAVLRVNALGDLVFSLPALEALRAAYPSAELVLLGRAWQRDLLLGRPGPVDRVVEVPVARGVREEPGVDEDPAEQDAFFAAMRAERFDLALQMHGGGRHSNPFVRRLGARIAAGSHTPDAERLDRSVPYVHLQHEVLRYLEIGGLVGAGVPPGGLDPRLELVEADRAEAASWVAADAPLAGLHPGASDPRRRWPAERFAALGDALAARGCAVVVTGTEAERPLVGEVRARMRAPSRDLLDAGLSLGGFAAALAACAVVVSNDSGPLHLAAAVGTPTVGLFWGPNCVNSPPPSRARHRPICVLDPRCPDCGADALRRACPHDTSLLGPVALDEVRAAAEDLLGLAPAEERALARAWDARA